jgi:hypothetical protein
LTTYPEVRFWSRFQTRKFKVCHWYSQRAKLRGRVFFVLCECDLLSNYEERDIGAINTLPNPPFLDRDFPACR